MKRRIDTVLRVAELREREARVRLAAHNVTLAAAQAASRARMLELTALRDLPLSGPRRVSDLRMEHVQAQLRAQSVLDAEQAEVEALDARSAALAVWKDATRRQAAFAELAVRARAADEALRAADEQRMLDDLGSRKPGADQ